MDDDTAKRLEAQDWRAIATRLVAYAAREVGIRHWRTGSTGYLPKGKSAEDLAYDAITKVWTGKRVWKPDDDPDLLRYLMDVVDSDLSALLKSGAHKRTERFPDGPEAEIPEPVGAGDASPEEALLAQELQDEILAACADDDELTLVACALVEGTHKAVDLAAETGLPVARIYKLKQKLKARMEKLGLHRQQSARSLPNVPGGHDGR